MLAASLPFQPFPALWHRHLGEGVCWHLGQLHVFRLLHAGLGAHLWVHTSVDLSVQYKQDLCASLQPALSWRYAAILVGMSMTC